MVSISISPIRFAGDSSCEARQDNIRQLHHSAWLGETLPGSARYLCERATFIVPLDRLNGGRKSQAFDSTAMNELRRAVPEASSIAVAINPVNHEGTRSHLDRISALRHMAEEWDVDIALDLTGDVDARWEAEAAMLRLGDRLKVVRLVPPSFDRAFVGHDSLHVREVSVARVLAAIADFGFGPTLSIKVGVPFWDWANPIAIAERCAIARNATIARFQVKSGSLPSPHRRVV
jgi:hypothetical protein